MTKIPNVIYKDLQTWFTTRMHTTSFRPKYRESIYDKAERILSDPSRVRTAASSNAPMFWVGEVDGDHGTYKVVALSEEFCEEHGITIGRLCCTCAAGTGRFRHGHKPILCSHMLVGEEMRVR